VQLRNENNRLLRVKKICGVGKDFVVFSVKEHGPLDPQYVKISRLIAPFFLLLQSSLSATHDLSFLLQATQDSRGDHGDCGAREVEV